MNRESSRSHSVFTLHIQSINTDPSTGLTDIRESRFNLVDLAGSERQNLTGSTGIRLKEAGNINKSLLALSNVMNALVDSTHGRPRHIQYRDSKLTFLLKDSLGGNSKTCIISNVNPSFSSFQETLSTLRFSQRAKLIKNKAIVNKDVLGNVSQLQEEVKKLKEQLYTALNKPCGVDSEFVPNVSVSTELTDLFEKIVCYHTENSSLRERLSLLEDLCKKREKQIQSERMIVKFRDSLIKTFKEKNGPDPFKEEKDLLIRELQEVQRSAILSPELTKCVYDHSQLQEKLFSLERFVPEFEKWQEKTAEKSSVEILALKSCLDLQKKLKEREADGSTESFSTVISSLEQERDILLATVENLESRLEHEQCQRENSHSASNSNKRHSPDISLDMCTQNSEEILILTDKLSSFEFENALLKRNIQDLSEQSSESQKTIEHFREESDRLMNVLLDEKRKHCETEQHLICEKEIRYKLEIDYAGVCDEIQRLKTVLNETDGVMAEKDVALDEANALFASIKREEEDQARKLVETNIRVSDLEQELVISSNSVQKLEIEIDSARNTKRSLERKLEEMVLSMEYISSENGILSEKCSHLESELKITIGTREEIEKILMISESRLKEAEISQKLLRSKIKHLDTELDAEKTRRVELETIVLKQKDAEIAELEHRMSGLESSLLNEESERKELVTRLQNICDENRNLLHRLESSESIARLKNLEEEKRNVESTLESKNRSEIAQLRDENDKLIQHQNAKQKLQYHVKIKQENNMLKEEIKILKEELLRHRDQGQ